MDRNEGNKNKKKCRKYLAGQVASVQRETVDVSCRRLSKLKRRHKNVIKLQGEMSPIE